MLPETIDSQNNPRGNMLARIAIGVFVVLLFLYANATQDERENDIYDYGNPEQADQRGWTY